MKVTPRKTSSAGILPAVPRACPELVEGASRPRRGGATLSGEAVQIMRSRYQKLLNGEESYSAICVFKIARPAAWVAAVWGRGVRPGNSLLLLRIAVVTFIPQPAFFCL